MRTPQEIIQEGVRGSFPGLLPPAIKVLSNGIANIATLTLAVPLDITHAQLTLQGPVGKHGVTSLGVRLQTLREKARLTQQQVAERARCSPSKIIRIESGMITVSHADAVFLLSLYNVTDQGVREEILKTVEQHKLLIREARKNALQRGGKDSDDLLATSILQAFPGLPATAVRVLTVQVRAIAGKAILRQWDLSSATLELGSGYVLVGMVAIGKILQEIREKARLTQQQVASKTGWSLSKLIRIEAGTVSVSYMDTVFLLQEVYAGAVDEATKARVLAAAEKHANQMRRARFLIKAARESGKLAA